MYVCMCVYVCVCVCVFMFLCVFSTQNEPKSCSAFKSLFNENLISYFSFLAILPCTFPQGPPRQCPRLETLASSFGPHLRSPCDRCPAAGEKLKKKKKQERNCENNMGGRGGRESEWVSK